MDARVDAYDTLGGGQQIDVSFWDDEEESLGHVGFASDGRGAPPRWLAKVFLAHDPRYERSATFEVLPGEPLARVVGERDKKRLGVQGWLLLEQAYRLAFPDVVRRNPTPVRGPVWRQLVTPGGHTKYEGALAFGGTTLLFNKYTRASARARWRAQWTLRLGVERGRVLGAAPMAVHDKIAANDLYREARAAGDTGADAW